MRKFLLGVAQLNIRDNISENLIKIEETVKELSEKGAEVIAFHEYSTYNAENSINQVAEYLNGDIIDFFRNLAIKYNTYIHNGSFARKIENNEKVYNTSVFINPKGEIEAIYNKIHLFDVNLADGAMHKESDEFEAGNEIVVLSNEIGDFGFAICYDLRFPEFFKAMAINGAKIIFMPAQFRLYTGKDHWEALLRARAIENGVYIVAPCGFGAFPPNEIRTYGNSMVVDPWGTVIARASERECCFMVEIDLDYIDEVRKSIPSLENRVDMDKLTVKRSVLK